MLEYAKLSNFYFWRNVIRATVQREIASQFSISSKILSDLEKIQQGYTKKTKGSPKWAKPIWLLEGAWRLAWRWALGARGPLGRGGPAGAVGGLGWLGL